MKQLSYVNRCCKPSDRFPEDCLFALHLVCHYDKHSRHSTHIHRYETQMLHWAVRPPHFHLAPKQLIIFVRGVKSVTFPFCSHAWPFHAALSGIIFWKSLAAILRKKWMKLPWMKKALNPAMWRLSFLDANRTNSFRIKSTSFSKEQLFCMLSISQSVLFSFKQTENGQKLIRLYWKCCTFFIKLIS